MQDSLLAVLASIPIVIFVLKRFRAPSHLDLPTVGYDGRLMSYFSSLRFLKEADVILRKGITQYHGRLFKIPQMDQWVAVASDHDFIENIRTAPEHILSMDAAIDDMIQADYTLGPQVKLNTYHIPVIRNFSLTQNLNAIFPELVDEITHAIEDEFGPKTNKNEWAATPAADTLTRIVCRVNHRVFVGLPLCRNTSYCNINIENTTNIIVGAAILNLFPKFLKPVIGRLMSKVTGTQRRLLVHLKPLIEERKRLIEEFGPSYPDKPNDMLTWLMDAAPPGLERTSESFVLRLLTVNFAALHSTSMTLTHAMYYLAAQPESIRILRTEIESFLDKDVRNWTKDSLETCWKLDSFLKESQRLHALNGLTMLRKAVAPYSFADGTTIPAGTTVAAATSAIHINPNVYDDPETFDPWRFSSMRERAVNSDDSVTREADDMRFRFTGTGPGYLAFGGGRHVCPGRFFVSIVMKAFIARLIMDYDLKMECEGVRPKDEWFGSNCVPNRHAKIMFRRRTATL
ncbi:cytochrome P450 [Collybia nuda]|uniref:Cytochrome P450 n=1 Tax=Collybia nuda TaxID=64659 RepID=A0A9P5XYG9_9AGAR|nr:cytochrome P450 [Collybia nuda]